MSEKTPAPPSSDATRPPAVGGDLLDMLDAALVAAWEDDRFVEFLAHDEESVGSFADLEYSIEVLRSALLTIERPDPGDKAMGENE